MKFTLSWLKKHLETSANLDEILLALTDLGLEVENVVDPIEALKDFTIGKVLSAEQHQNADKLRVCQVQTDEGELQINLWCAKCAKRNMGRCSKAWCICPRYRNNNWGWKNSWC